MCDDELKPLIDFIWPQWRTCVRGFRMAPSPTHLSNLETIQGRGVCDSKLSIIIVFIKIGCNDGLAIHELVV